MNLAPGYAIDMEDQESIKDPQPRPLQKQSDPQSNPEFKSRLKIRRKNQRQIQICTDKQNLWLTYATPKFERKKKQTDQE